MQAIIPAKTSSQRVYDKNWRPFYAGKCLVDINIEALKQAGIESGCIYVSCESQRHLDYMHEKHGVKGILRDPVLCDNDAPITDWIRTLAGQVPGDDPIIWSQVCDPLFDEHAEALDEWEWAERHGYDSLVVVHPIGPYVLDSNFCPVGWQFGEYHIKSQSVLQKYQFPFTLSVLTRECIQRCGYHIGKNPFYYVSEGVHIDIDTEEDFAVAKAYYAARKEK